MTESTSPMDDTQTFEAPTGIDPDTGMPTYAPQQLQVGTCDLVPQHDGSGAILTYTIDGACQIFVAIPEECVRNFTNLRRVMAGRRITLATRQAPRKIPGLYDADRFPDPKKYR